MKNHQEVITERDKLLEHLESLEADQMDYQHAWNKRLHSYRRQRRKLLDELHNINQLRWEFESG